MGANFQVDNFVLISIMWYRPGPQVLTAAIGGVNIPNVLQVLETGSGATTAFMGRITVGGQNTVQLTCNGATYAHWSVAELSGPQNALTIDQQPAQTLNASPNNATITSGTLAQADEFALTAVANSESGGTWSIPGGWNTLLNQQDWTNVASGAVFWQNTAGTAPLTVTMGSPGNKNYGRMGLVTVKNKETANDGLWMGVNF
jgi:hypothetical protein